MDVIIMKTLADIKRAMQQDTLWHCFNNLYGSDMGTRRISKRASDFVTFETARPDGEIVHSRFDFPKADEITFNNEYSFTVNYNGSPKLTYSLRGV